MPWNGSGVVTVTYDFSDDRDAGVPDAYIQADRVDQNFSDLISAIENTLALDGQTTPTANITWGAYNLTNIGKLSLGAGTSALPSFYREGDPNTGLFFPGADQIEIVAGGTKVLSSTSSALTLALPTTFNSTVVGPAGTTAAPAFTTVGDTDNGMLFPAANTLAFAAGGTKFLSSTSSATNIYLATAFSLATAFASGTSAAPGISYIGDTDTGISRPAANTLGFSTAGSRRVTIDSGGQVGVGTSSPLSFLNIEASVGTKAIIFSDGSGGAGNYRSSISFVHNGGSAASNSMTFNVCDSSTTGTVAPLTLLGTGEARISGTPTALSTDSIGFRGAPVNTQDTAYGLVLTDAGKTLYHTSASTHTWTIPANASVAYPIGTIILLENESGGGNVTIAITSDTLRWSSSTGSRTLAANGSAAIKKVASTTWRMTGVGIS